MEDTHFRERVQWVCCDGLDVCLRVAHKIRYNVGRGYTHFLEGTMLKSATLLGSILCAGIVLGLALATLGRSAPAPATQDLQTAPAAPSTTLSATDEPPITPLLASAPLAASETLQAKVSYLSKQRDAASAARQQLQDELSQVKTTIQTLEQRLDELSKAEPVDTPQPRAIARSRQSEAKTFTAAGFDANEAEYLANRWGQQQMDLLYLRDEAIRDGWINTPRYEQAARELRRGSDSIREELGPEAYDRFLFAAGRANRVVLNSVIDSSPGQAVGLQPGDTILSYDGNRIFSFSDLRNATTAGEPDAPVVIAIDRDGQRLEFEIARGPIGVTLGSQRAEP